MIYLFLQEINSFSFLIWIKKEQKCNKHPPPKKNKTRKTMKIVDTSPSILE